MVSPVNWPARSASRRRPARRRGGPAAGPRSPPGRPPRSRSRWPAPRRRRGRARPTRVASLRTTAAGSGSRAARSSRSICWRRVERPPARMRVLASVARPLTRRMPPTSMPPPSSSSSSAVPSASSPTTPMARTVTPRAARFCAALPAPPGLQLGGLVADDEDRRLAADPLGLAVDVLVGHEVAHHHHLAWRGRRAAARRRGSARVGGARAPWFPTSRPVGRQFGSGPAALPAAPAAPAAASSTAGGASTSAPDGAGPRPPACR